MIYNRHFSIIILLWKIRKKYFIVCILQSKKDTHQTHFNIFYLEFYDEPKKLWTIKNWNIFNNFANFIYCVNFTLYSNASAADYWPNFFGKSRIYAKQRIYGQTIYGEKQKPPVILFNVLSASHGFRGSGWRQIITFSCKISHEIINQNKTRFINCWGILYKTLVN